MKVKLSPPKDMTLKLRIDKRCPGQSFFRGSSIAPKTATTTSERNHNLYSLKINHINRERRLKAYSQDASSSARTEEGPFPDFSLSRLSNPSTIYLSLIFFSDGGETLMANVISNCYIVHGEAVVCATERKSQSYWYPTRI